jgi:hypothetical protein
MLRDRPSQSKRKSRTGDARNYFSGCVNHDAASPGQRSKEAHAYRHQAHRDETTLGRRRIAIAVTDCRDGRHRPPERILGSLDVAGLAFKLELGDRAGEDHEDRDQDGRPDRALAPARRQGRGQHASDFDDAERAQDANDPPDTSEAEVIDRRNARDEVEPAPRAEVAPAIVRTSQIADEIDEEECAQDEVALVEQLSRFVGQRHAGAKHQEHESEDRQRAKRS